jgi:hypothetical protein
MLISKGAKVNRTGGNSWDTPLSSAIRFGNKDIAELLISNGADINASDSHGWTPYMYAIKRGYKEIAQMLIDHGAHTSHTCVFETTGKTEDHEYGLWTYEEMKCSICGEIKWKCDQF